MVHGQAGANRSFAVLQDDDMRGHNQSGAASTMFDFSIAPFCRAAYISSGQRVILSAAKDLSAIYSIAFSANKT